ncbi:MAG: VCBS repeat-containing protein [Polyangiaceae bacterium]|nr:VCBS repeat-containing protein [Polyangiaceae bacterium]
MRAASGQGAPKPASPAATPTASASAAPTAAPSAAVTSSAAPATPPALKPVQRAVPSVSAVAESIAQTLGALKSPVFVASAPLAQAPAGAKGDRLVATITALIAGKYQEGAKLGDAPMTLTAARGSASKNGASALVYTSIELASGKVRVTADVYPVPQTMWSIIRNPEPAPISHAFAEAVIDAEIRSFLPAIPIVTAQVDRGRNFESDVVAIACGDLDRDGSLELGVVSRRRVTTSRIVAGKVEPLQGKAWSDLSPVNGAPLREPYGFATFVERKAGTQSKTTFDVSLTDRALSVRLDRAMTIDSTFAGLALPDGAATACANTMGLVISGAFTPCQKEDGAPLAPSVGGKYDAFASAALTGADGKPYVVWAGRENGVVELRDNGSHAARISDLGAQLAVGDLDQDGDPEIIGALDTLNAEEDAVIVKTWRRSSNKIEDKLKLPAAAGVRALGVCTPDGLGHTPFVVATADEIWVVR